ncbi:tubulin epsilon and delta complex protein 1 isoform 1 [Daubentonia madagascariensis]|uniref:Tubulin epsilon and delta complex protein 1 isoform 1 n=1 Tax=Daubentonia madagascariensis TaxID=31869 RepID=A0ABD2ET78_DAUMA
MGRRRRLVDPAAKAGAGALPEVIAALSRSLPAGPSPEIFRRAKFDRPEAAPALWRLLFRLLSPLSADGASPTLAQEAQASLVKSALRSQGYPRLALAQLPEDGSRGSRELLLALSWLLARAPLPERLLAQAHVQLGDEMPVCECEALASPGPWALHVEAEGPVDIRCVQWLMGRLRFRWRCLTASQQEQCTLLSKIHLYTRGCHSDRSLGHLSVAETEMLRDPEGGQQVGGQGRGPQWSTARQALQEAVEQELAALRWAWEQDRGPARPHGPHRLVRLGDEAPGGQYLRAAEVIQALKSQEACLEAALRRLQGQCRQELARLAGALPGLIWILPPRR